MFGRQTVACLILLGAASVRCQAQEHEPRLTIEAQLYYSDSGRLSRDVLSMPAFRLWNAHVGEGSLDGASTQTIVVVKVRTLQNVSNRGRLRLLATTQDATLEDRVVRVGVPGSDGYSRVVFVLHETACDRISIVVQLQFADTAGPVAEERATLDFRCGN